MYSLYQTVLIYCGYVLVSVFCGFLMSVSIRNKRFLNQILCFTMEFSAGFTTSMVLLEAIPSIYRELRAEELISFLILGLFTAMLLQEQLKYRKKEMSPKKRISATQKISVLSFAVSNLLRGLSVGTGRGMGLTMGAGFGISAAVYAFTESASVFLMSKAAEKSASRSLLLCFLMSVPFLSGALPGAYLGSLSKKVLSRALAFSCGIALYSAIGDMGIESKLLYHGRFLPIFRISGMIFGITFILYS